MDCNDFRNQYSKKVSNPEMAMRAEIETSSPLCNSCNSHKRSARMRNAWIIFSDNDIWIGLKHAQQLTPIMSLVVHNTIDAIITSAFICSSLITPERKRWPGSRCEGNGSEIHLTVSGHVKSLYKYTGCPRISDCGGAVPILRAVFRVAPEYTTSEFQVGSLYNLRAWEIILAMWIATSQEGLDKF
jgi:hypothetical protein